MGEVGELGHLLLYLPKLILKAWQHMHHDQAHQFLDMKRLAFMHHFIYPCYANAVWELILE